MFELAKIQVLEKHEKVVSEVFLGCWIDVDLT